MELMWSSENPYHVARYGKGNHYSIECVDGPVRYFEVKGTGVYPFKKFLTLDEAKEWVNHDYNLRSSKPKGE